MWRLACRSHERRGAEDHLSSTADVFVIHTVLASVKEKSKAGYTVV